MSDIAAIAPRNAAIAQSLSFGNTFDWLVERFGPVISDILVDILKNRASVLPAGQTLSVAAISLDSVKTMLSTLLKMYGPSLVTLIGDKLTEKANAMPTKGSSLPYRMAASSIREFGGELIEELTSFISSPAVAPVAP